MRRALYSLLWATVLASVVLAPAATAAAAAGSTTSAGDQQYLDPLAPSTTSASPPSIPAPVAPPVLTPAAGRRAGSASPHTSRRTLPYTGLNLWILAGAGLGLIALGLALRRLARRQAGDDAL